jgi:hypothetical protein
MASRKNSLSWGPEQVAAHNAKVRGSRVQAGQLAGNLLSAEQQRTLRAAEATKRFQALGRLPKGTMNKTEAAYAEELERQRQLGLIHGYKFHALKIRLADNAFYEADFLVLGRDFQLAIHETKGGFTTDKGQLKIRLAAEALPWFRFFKATKLAQKAGGGWKIEEFNA